MRRTSYSDTEGAFHLTVPDDWEIARDEEGGLLLSRGEGGGLLHVLPFAREEEGDVDPAEELYAFLEDQDIEIEEDEVEDLDLPSGAALALCEYVAEEEEDAVYWMVGVASAPGQLVFASFSCPAEDEDEERETVRRILSTLAFDAQTETRGDE